MSIGALVREANRRRRENGLRAAGARPYGYQWVGKRGQKTIAPDEFEQSVLRLIRRMTLDGYTASTIAECVNRWGVVWERNGVAGWKASRVWALVRRPPIEQGHPDDQPVSIKGVFMAVRQRGCKGHWCVTLGWKGKTYHLGTFVSRADADEHYKLCREMALAGSTDFPKSPKSVIYDPHARKHAALMKEIISLYSSGATIKEVSSMTGVPVMTVHSMLVESGIPRRRRSRSPQGRNTGPAAGCTEVQGHPGTPGG
jgi:hypothetical protein